MIGTITPLVYAAPDGSRPWWRAVGAYSIGTAVTTIPMGLLLGTLGRTGGGPYGWAAVALVLSALLLALHETRILRLPIPMIQRQTRQFWRTRFGSTAAALLWGADIGLLFSTRTTFVSIWFIAAVAVLAASPLIGVILTGCYGLGRILLVLSGPALARRGDDGAAIFPDLPQQATWHALHAVVLLAGAIIISLGGLPT